MTGFSSCRKSDNFFSKNFNLKEFIWFWGTQLQNQRGLYEFLTTFFKSVTWSLFDLISYPDLTLLRMTVGDLGTRLCST